MASNQAFPRFTLSQALGQLPFSRELRRALQVREGDEFFKPYDNSHELNPDQSLLRESAADYVAKSGHHLRRYRDIFLFVIGAESKEQQDWALQVSKYLAAFLCPLSMHWCTPLKASKLRFFMQPGGCLHGDNLLDATERAVERRDDRLYLGLSFEKLSEPMIQTAEVLVVEAYKFSLAEIAREVVFKCGQMQPCRYFSCALNPQLPKGPFCLCVICLRKISLLESFSANTRYIALYKFYKEVGASLELGWVRER